MAGGVAKRSLSLVSLLLLCVSLLVSLVLELLFVLLL